MPLIAPTVRPALDLEKVIRPLVNPAPRADRARTYFNGGQNTTGATVTTEGEDIPTLEWECLARAETTTIESLGLRVLDDNNQIEEERETHTERIFSETVPEAYVDVEVMDKVSFKTARNKRLFLTFTNPS